MFGCRFVHDQHGTLQSVELTAAVYGTLTTVYLAARDAQTRALEARGGRIPSSLGNLGGPAPRNPTSLNGTTPAKPATTARARLAGLFMTHQEAAAIDANEHAAVVETETEATAGGVPGPAETSPHSATRPRFLPQTFLAPIPEEVSRLITDGIHFLAAWRQYRELTVEDAAELNGVSVGAIEYHERGSNVPRRATLARFAEVYDCQLEQLIAVASIAAASETHASMLSQSGHGVTQLFAPHGTSYPTGVLNHIRAGKSALTAWRLHRGLSVGQCADRYGIPESSFKSLDAHSARTREKLAAVFGCKPAQLLPPADMRVASANDAAHCARHGT